MSCRTFGRTASSASPLHQLPTRRNDPKLFLGVPRATYRAHSSTGRSRRHRDENRPERLGLVGPTCDLFRRNRVVESPRAFELFEMCRIFDPHVRPDWELLPIRAVLRRHVHIMALWNDCCCNIAIAPTTLAISQLVKSPVAVEKVSFPEKRSQIRG
jgi:hypothetical protein